MAKKKEWREGEMILTFGLTKIDIPDTTPLMQEWLHVENPQFDSREEANFEYLIQKVNKVRTWSEEDLKMKFISPLLELGELWKTLTLFLFSIRKLSQM